jgi:hypothetical protein
LIVPFGASCPIVGTCQYRVIVNDQEFMVHVVFRIVDLDRDAIIVQKLNVRTLIKHFKIVSKYAYFQSAIPCVNQNISYAVITNGENADVYRGSSFAD